jgi:hypothetical protein
MKHFKLSQAFAILKIKNDYNDNFDSTTFDKFCIENSFNHEFSIPRTLQPNEIVGRKNRLPYKIRELCLISMVHINIFGWKPLVLFFSCFKLYFHLRSRSLI